MRVLIGCEFSGVVRRAFAARGHDAWSCDLLPAGDGSNRHFVGDVRDYLDLGWDLLAVFHPPCTRLCNSGVRWLHTPPPGRSLEQMWAELDVGAALFSDLWNAKIPRVCVENPVMHRYAKERIANWKKPQTVQPWWFGDPAFKGTGLYLRGLPELVDTNRLTPPAPGSAEHKSWSAIHRAPPGPNRWAFRSQTFPGIAAAMADQWGNLDGLTPELREMEGGNSMSDTPTKRRSEPLDPSVARLIARRTATIPAPRFPLERKSFLSLDTPPKALI